MKAARVLIAGIGNIFLGDDAFGVEVAKRMAGRPMAPDIRVVDFGIRGIDLAYALLENYERIILVDTALRGEAPGTLYLIEPLVEESGTMRTHEMRPVEALSAARAMGAGLANVVIVGCEPESFGTEDELQTGLSVTVAAAVDEAVAMIEGLAAGAREAADA
jgi:hydrogenase maturation protease